MGGSMLPAIGSGVQAMKAIGTRFSVTAHNVAHASTDGFLPKRGLLVEGQKGAGPAVQIQSREILSPSLPALSEVRPEQESLTLPSQTDLGVEMTHSIRDTRAYGANARQLRTADDMLGSLLSIRE